MDAAGVRKKEIKGTWRTILKKEIRSDRTKSSSVISVPAHLFVCVLMKQDSELNKNPRINAQK